MEKGVLPVIRRWSFACLRGPVSGMPRIGAGPQTGGSGPRATPKQF